MRCLVKALISAVVFIFICNLSPMAHSGANDINLEKVACCSPAPNDFNGDGRSDIAWYNPTNGKTRIWLMNGLQQIDSGQSGGATYLDWTIRGYGDFDNDGNDDILWSKSATEGSRIWFMDGTTFSYWDFAKNLDNTSKSLIKSDNWALYGCGDFDGDKKADMHWFNSYSGQSRIWLMDGPTQLDTELSGGATYTSWEPKGYGDFDGDEKCDILWYNPSTGATRIWFMDGLNFSSWGFSEKIVDTDWQIAGVGDFDGDCKADIHWFHSNSGKSRIWLMDGLTQTESEQMGNDTYIGWEPKGHGDYDGDCHADILWYDSATGATRMWFMDGTVIDEWGNSKTINDTVWQIP